MINHKYLQHAVIAFSLLSLVACATISDVNRAATLNRMDNKLPNLLKDLEAKEEHKREMSKVELLQMVDESNRLAIEANGSDDLQKAQAIGFYRVAATAAWKSKSPEKLSMVFKASNLGISICDSMQANRPDRDCFYLAVVPTYVAAEDTFTTQSNSGVNFDSYHDDLKQGVFSDKALAKSKEIIAGLNFLSNHVLEADILSENDKAMLVQHQSLLAYYCKQSETIAEGYNTIKQALVPSLFLYFNKKQSDGIANPFVDLLGFTDTEFLDFNSKNAVTPTMCN